MPIPLDDVGGGYLWVAYYKKSMADPLLPDLILVMIVVGNGLMSDDNEPLPGEILSY